MKTVEIVWCSDQSHKNEQSCHCPLRKAVRAETCLRLPWTDNECGPRVCQIRSVAVPYSALIFIYRESHPRKTTKNAMAERILPTPRHTSKRRKRSSSSPKCAAEKWEDYSEAIVVRSTKRPRSCRQAWTESPMERSDTGLTGRSTTAEDPEWPSLVEDLLARPGPVPHTRVSNAFSSLALIGSPRTDGCVGASQFDDGSSHAITSCDYKSRLCHEWHSGGAFNRECIE